MPLPPLPTVLEPCDPLIRAEDRLASSGDLDGCIRDAAHVVDMVARLLDDGAGFIPHDHEAHTTVSVETSRLRHAADRLRKVAPDAQRIARPIWHQIVRAKAGSCRDASGGFLPFPLIGP
ncbi:hypothetical protein ACWGIA_21645 [Streptomyces bobili]